MIDARGSLCPGPLLDLIRMVRAAPVGATLSLLSSDSGSNKDVPIWIAKTQHALVGVYPEAGYTRFGLVRFDGASAGCVILVISHAAQRNRRLRVSRRQDHTLGA